MILKRNYSKALELLNQAIEIAPNYFTARTNRISVLMALDRNEDALEEAKYRKNMHG